MAKMGLFTRQDRRAGPPKRGTVDVPLDRLHELECKACPLRDVQLRHPEMAPTGANKPDIYILGEAPGEDEDRCGEQFVGKAGETLRRHVPRSWRDVIRWNNTVRCHPPKNATPGTAEIECCRPSVEADIAKTKPLVILGTGAIPLKLLLGGGKITIGLCRGRRFPVRVGGHCCWFYPVHHPSFINRIRDQRYEKIPGKEWEAQFERDIAQVFDDVDGGRCDPPEVEDAEHLNDGIQIVTGGDDGLRKIQRTFERMAGYKSISVDIEANALRPYGRGAKCLSVAIGRADDTIAFPLHHPLARWTKGQLGVLLTALEGFLRTSRCLKIAQNLSMEQEWFAFMFGEGLLFDTRWGDTMAQAYVLDEREGGHNLDFLCLLHFGIHLKHYSQVDVKNQENEPLEKCLWYNGRDTKYEHRLYHVQRKLIVERGLEEAYRLMNKRVPTVTVAQVRGLSVDQEIVCSLDDVVKKDIARVEHEIQDQPEVRKYGERYGAFSPTSPKQVEVLLSKVCKRREGADERSGKYSVDKKVLEQMSDLPVAGLILRHRFLSKLGGTYLDALHADSKKTVVWPDGRVHTSFNTTFTDTGRLSSNDPNMQNYPKRVPEAKRVRQAFVADPGCVLVSTDYGQIEARVIGMASKDKVLCKALWERYDIHLDWSERIAAVAPQVLKVKHHGDIKHMRTAIKNEMVFPAFFGSMMESIAGSVGVHPKVMGPLFDEFWEMFDGVLQWQKRLMNAYRENHYVEMLTGRRRHAPLSKNMVINTCAQGTAADIVLDAMDRLALYAHEHDLPYLQPVLNIHDDLTFNVPKKKVDIALEVITREMCSVPWDFVNVPITVEVESGPNWWEMKEVGKYSSDEL